MNFILRNYRAFYCYITAILIFVLHRKMRILSILSLVFILYFGSCTGNTDYVPRQTGYFRIALPKRKYTTYSSPCPFTFEYPVYASVLPDTGHFCWLNVAFSRLHCNIYMSYLTVNRNLQAYTEECRRFVVEHEIKASAINEQTVSNAKDKIYGVIYDIEGNAASNVQFYLTDSTHHFVRGALYFYAVPNKDSLAPVLNFVKEDINHLVQSFRWKTAESIPPKT